MVQWLLLPPPLPPASSSSSSLWLETVVGPCSHDSADAGKVEMRAGDGQPVGGDPVEGATARLPRDLRIDVVFERRLRPRHLDRRDVHDVAPDQERVAAGMDD